MGKEMKIIAHFDPALLKRVDAYATKRYADRSAAIQQLVSFALREINKKEAVQAYRDGRMTIRQCADMLGVDYFEMNEILNAEDAPIVYDLIEDKETLLSTLQDSLAKSFEPK